ncbi:hypothetical protein [Streptomyces sp. NPDC046925]|uniref:hypothetical protein n=1 Tax=Streptomyces sp. NPDC046925 TaxID=3155375 RepID=UPI00340771F1
MRSSPEHVVDLRTGPAFSSPLVTRMPPNTLLTENTCYVKGERYGPLCNQVAGYDGWASVTMLDGRAGYAPDVCIYLR